MKYRATLTWTRTVDNADTLEEAREHLYAELDQDISSGELEFTEFEEVD